MISRKAYAPRTTVFNTPPIFAPTTLAPPTLAPTFRKRNELLTKKKKKITHEKNIVGEAFVSHGAIFSFLRANCRRSNCRKINCRRSNCRSGSNCHRSIYRFMWSKCHGAIVACCGVNVGGAIIGGTCVTDSLFHLKARFLQEITEEELEKLFKKFISNKCPYNFQ